MIKHGVYLLLNFGGPANETESSIHNLMASFSSYSQWKGFAYLIFVLNHLLAA